MQNAQPLSLTQHTLYADLLQRCLDAAFDTDFPDNGSFIKREVSGRGYFYYQGYTPASATGEQGRRFQRYAGPADDPEIAKRVERFNQIKTSAKERRELVRSLRAIGLPSPDALTGDLTDALWRAGLFRLRGVLIGTVAYQTYTGLLGVRLDPASAMTADLDIAQFHSIAMSVDDALPPILGTLRSVDPTFHDIPHQIDGRTATAFVNARGYRVEFLTPNRGSDEHQGRAAPMPTLGGAAAQPLRFLDYLIYQPVRSVLLHKAGVPVLVPDPARYAIHKLIVSTQRRADSEASFAKARKDLLQSGSLVRAYQTLRRPEEIGHAWLEAWDRGPQWRRHLAVGAAQLDGRDELRAAIEAACAEGARDPATAGLDEI